MIRSMAGSVHIVKGDADLGYDFPEYKVVKIGEVKVGLIHGHQIIPWGDLSALSAWQRKLDCDILVSGHTHKSSVQEDMGKFYINPGSVTGAYQPWGASGTSEPGGCPSFMLMAINGPSVALYVYEEKDGKANVVMSELSTKPASPATTAASPTTILEPSAKPTEAPREVPSEPPSSETTADGPSDAK
eukprot:Selendium_serpulae@DN3739_c0_g1_i2.p1